MASLKGLTKLEAKRKAKELLELVSLSDVGKKKIATAEIGIIPEVLRKIAQLCPVFLGRNI